MIFNKQLRLTEILDDDSKTANTLKKNFKVYTIIDKIHVVYNSIYLMHCLNIIQKDKVLEKIRTR